jgi:hypothetical protein
LMRVLCLSVALFLQSSAAGSRHSAPAWGNCVHGTHAGEANTIMLHDTAQELAGSSAQQQQQQ